MCSVFYCVVTENTHTHPTEGLWKFQGGGGLNSPKIYKRKYEAKLEIPGGRGVGVKRKGGMNIFCNYRDTVMVAELAKYQADFFKFVS